VIPGPIEVDPSALTGDSLPAGRKTRDAVFSASIVRQGEIGGLVNGSGADTYFGPPSRSARSGSSWSPPVLGGPEREALVHARGELLAE
jgi:H+-transporting ATPase